MLGWFIKQCFAETNFYYFSGDELYVKDSDFLEKPMSTDKKTEELVKEGKVVNRMVIHSLYHYEIYVSLLSKDKLVYPKNYVVNKSLPAHLWGAPLVGIDWSCLKYKDCACKVVSALFPVLCAFAACLQTAQQSLRVQCMKC